MQAPVHAACTASKRCGLETQFGTTIDGADNTSHLALKKSVIPFIPSSTFSHLGSSGSQVPRGHRCPSSSKLGWSTQDLYTADLPTLRSVNAIFIPTRQSPLTRHVLGWTSAPLRLWEWSPSHSPKLSGNNPVNCRSYPLPRPALRSAWKPNTLPPQQTDPRSTRAPPPSWAWHPKLCSSSEKGQQGCRGQTPNLPQGQTLLLEEPPCTSYDLPKSEPRLQRSF